MENNEIKLWAFYYCPMTQESASYIESYHRTEAGARKAMNEHKLAELAEWNECYKGENEPFPFGKFQDWYVNEFTLKIEE